MLGFAHRFPVASGKQKRYRIGIGIDAGYQRCAGCPVGSFKLRIDLHQRGNDRPYFCCVAFVNGSNDDRHLPDFVPPQRLLPITFANPLSCRTARPLQNRLANDV